MLRSTLLVLNNLSWCVDTAEHVLCQTLAAHVPTCCHLQSALDWRHHPWVWTAARSTHTHARPICSTLKHLDVLLSSLRIRMQSCLLSGHLIRAHIFEPNNCYVKYTNFCDSVCEFGAACCLLLHSIGIHLFWPGVTCGITFFDNKLFYYRIRVSVFCPTENYRCFASVCIIICWLMWWVVSRVHAHVHVTVGCTAGWADVIIVLHCCSCTFCQ